MAENNEYGLKNWVPLDVSPRYDNSDSPRSRDLPESSVSPDCRYSLRYLSFDKRYLFSKSTNKLVSEKEVIFLENPCLNNPYCMYFFFKQQ